MILGIDIGGTSIKSAIVYEKDQAIKFKEHSKTPTMAKERGGQGIREKIIEIVSQYKKRVNVTGVAISSAGVVNGESFEILYANENIPDYIGINLAKEIRSQFDLPCIVENDVNAATLGEWKYGSGRNCSSILCLTVGTGIGGGIVLNNQLYRGHSYCAAEVGYMTLKDSNFEKLASTQTLVDKVRAKKKDLSLDGESIFKLALNGDKICIQEIDRMVKNLCLGIINCVYLLNPEKIILGGGVMEQRDYLLPQIKKNFEDIYKNSMGTTDIAAADLGNSACLAGAYWLFNEHYG